MEGPSIFLMLSSDSSIENSFVLKWNGLGLGLDAQFLALFKQKESSCQQYKGLVTDLQGLNGNFTKLKALL